MKSRFSLLVLLALLPLASLEAAEGKSETRLLVAAAVARPGETVLAAVELKAPLGWHTYWRFGGDSGQPTTIAWSLPAGVEAGEIRWPAPQKLTESGITTYVYYGDVLLLVPLKLTNNLAPGKLDLKATVVWLECKDICLPGKASVAASLEVGSVSQPSPDAELIRAGEQKIPQTRSGLAARAWWEGPAKGDSRSLLIQWATAAPLKEADFFPYSGDPYDVQAAVDLIPAEPGQVRVRKLIKKPADTKAWPTQLPGLLIEQPGSDQPTAAMEATLMIASNEGTTAGETSQPPTNPDSPAPAANSLLVMLGFAFLGGLILNIMPCVLPVIALKILSFVSQSKRSGHTMRKLGLMYGLGVLVSFWVLAAIVIGVQQAGRTANWGMQFQNPQFLIGITILVTLVALNLFGVFEVTLGGGAMNAAGELAAKEGNAGAFFNGVLATVLATPCTAPFLAVALGFAFSQSPAIILLMFSFVGLGLAAPYVVLSWHPAWLKLLPKPGVWMQKFKVAMGFPMLATAIWLFTLATARFGKDGVLWLGLFLVSLALVAWIWGEFIQRGFKRRGLAGAVCVLLLAVSYGYSLEDGMHWRTPPAAASRDARNRDADGIAWEVWNAEAVAQARAAGRPVFVDFTADWCLSCKVNARTSIEIPSVRAKLKTINALALIGDYTDYNDAITAELKKFARAGVPLVLVYPSDTNAAPQVLPALLTPGVVLDALDKAATARPPVNSAAR